MTLRIATASFSRRIFAGHPTTRGTFREPRTDVTNDVYEAIKDHIGIGHQITLHRDGEPSFTIAILPVGGSSPSAAEDGQAESTTPNPIKGPHHD